MLKNLIILPDGTELFSGIPGQNAIRSVTLTECVNSEKELTIGSVCSYMLEAVIWNLGGNLKLSAGDEITLYKVKDDGTRHKAGIFIVKTPARPSRNILKITAYDRASKLDTDITLWFRVFESWGVELNGTLFQIADLVCKQCGLVLKNTAEELPRADFPVSAKAFTQNGAVTGRKALQWLGEICGMFVRATVDGEIEFSWYEIRNKKIFEQKDRFDGKTSIGNYYVQQLDGVQIQMRDETGEYYWPENSGLKNPYIISGNLVLELAEKNDYLKSCLDAVMEQINVALTLVAPCKFSIPAQHEIRAGDIFGMLVDDADEDTPYAFLGLCMTKTQKGQIDTIECTGSFRRDGTTR